MPSFAVANSMCKLPVPIKSPRDCINLILVSVTPGARGTLKCPMRLTLLRNQAPMPLTLVSKGGVSAVPELI